MAFEKEKQFLEKMMADEELRAKMKAADPEEVIKIAKEAGFDINGEDLEKAAREIRANSDTEISKISLEDMDKVAGGQLWCGEKAPDGHEMGCTAFFYDEAWQLRNKIYCKENYFCLDGFYQGTSFIYSL